LDVGEQRETAEEEDVRVSSQVSKNNNSGKGKKNAGKDTYPLCISNNNNVSIWMSGEEEL